jgi:putative oxidoreductase
MSLLENKKDLGILIFRLGFGFGFIYFHGWGKITGGIERWERLGGAMENIGIGFAPVFWGFMAALTESAGALMFAAGLFFRPVSLLLAFTMLIAMISHISSGQGNPGNAFKNLSLFIGAYFIGPGKYSIDEWLKKRRKG